MASVLIILPTYNERENLRTVTPLLREVAPHAHVLIVDDNSPDGTGALADELAARDPAQAIHVLHRTVKNGLGRAYVEGFAWALARPYERIVQMDADLSHHPRYLPDLLAASQTHDLVLGSRYVTGGGTANWGVTRRLLSRGGSLYARTILGLGVRDLTGGFRCWQRHVLEDINLPTMRSNGYSFMIETLYRARLRGHSVKEVPIIFADRVEGQSKMSKKIIVEAMTMVWKLRAQAPAIRGARPGAAISASTASAS